MADRRARDSDRDQFNDLRDVLHAMRDDGHPLVMPDPGTEHGRRLYVTLGVEIDRAEPVARQARPV